MNNLKINNDITEEEATRVILGTSIIIDDFFSDLNSRVKCLVEVEARSLSDHNVLTINVDKCIKVYKPKVEYQTKSVDHIQFQILVSRKVGRSAVESFQHLINIIVECKKQSEIVKVFKIRKHNTWINDEVLQMMKQRDKLYKEKVKNPNNIALNLEF